MKITIENTEKMVSLNGIPARIWQGKTESGIEVVCFITRICIEKKIVGLTEQFENELMETRAPTAIAKVMPIEMRL